MLKWIALLLGLPVAVALLEILAVTWIESSQTRRLEGEQPYSLAAAGTSRTAVVYFSRSGNTALAARHVAQRLDAQLFPLEVPAYRLGPIGLLHALKDAHTLKSRPEMLPGMITQSIDLTPFDTVWLGSPVWLYSPAPPIWAFVEQHRFDGQHVVLFNTFNSHFGDDHIATFQARVMAHGARSFEHRTVLRGRMPQQIATKQMLRAIDEQWFDSSTKP